jgi:tripartite-type tricarboxylate transporter receptor subunit TctC
MMPRNRGESIPSLHRTCYQIDKALASTVFKERLASEAIDPMPMTPEQFGKFMQAELLHWSALARERKISLDD